MSSDDEETGTTTLELVGVERRSLEDYRRIVGDGLVDAIRLPSAHLKGTWNELRKINPV